jgi:aminomethyltransferase
LVLYTSLLNQAGGMIDDLTIYRLGPEHFWLVATPSRADLVERLLCEHAREMRAYVTNLVPGTAYLSIQGPNSRALLARLTEADLSSGSLPYFRFIHAVVAEVPMVLSRTGYSGELGYELYYSRDYAEHVWDAVLETGADLGATPAGLGALRSVRIEKKYPLYGLDINDTTTPWEAGLGWTVDFDGREFAGRDTLLRQRDAGVDRRLAGLALPDLSVDPPRPGSGLEYAGSAAGTVTSSDRGYTLGRTLALGFVAPSVVEGSVVSVAAGDGQLSSATVTFEPFYDPRGERLRS